MNIGIGTKLYGFCNGFFGRDSYEDKIIEGIGNDWIVARDSNGNVQFALFDGEWKRIMESLIKNWSINENNS